MSATGRNATEFADLVLQLGRAAYADCAAGGLTQAQWIAMRYFARANRFSRTVSGFADFHGTTRGTASQTIKSLVEHAVRAAHFSCWSPTSRKRESWGGVSSESTGTGYSSEKQASQKPRFRDPDTRCRASRDR